MKKITGYKTITGHFRNNGKSIHQLKVVQDRLFQDVLDDITGGIGLEQFIDRLDLVIHYPPEDTPQQEAVNIIRQEIIRVCNEAKNALDNLQMLSNVLRTVAEGRAKNGVEDNGVTKLADQLDHFHGNFQQVITERIREARKIKAEPLGFGYVDKELETAISAFFAGADGLPVEAVDKEAHRLAQRYANIRQGPVTNSLTKARSNKRNTKTDPITGITTLKMGALTLTADNFSNIKNIKTSTQQFLGIFTAEYTANGLRDPKIRLPLSEFMKKRGLSDRKEARKQVETEMETLFNIRISFKEKRRGQETDYLDLRICDTKGIIQNGIITFYFGNGYTELLRKYTIMPVVPKLFLINGKRNPYSYALLWKLSEHHNMNVGRKNENTIAVKTLLEACENMPRYEDVMASDRRVRARIIDPFERDLDELADTLSWHYCHSNNEPLTDKELEAMDYDLFTTLLIHFDFYEWPDQTERLQRKAERIEAAKKKSSSSRGRKKAAQD